VPEKTPVGAVTGCLFAVERRDHVRREPTAADPLEHARVHPGGGESTLLAVRLYGERLDWDRLFDTHPEV
jgi:hypothetical protein